jgi:hypothetical protein
MAALEAGFGKIELKTPLKGAVEEIKRNEIIPTEAIISKIGITRGILLAPRFAEV